MDNLELIVFLHFHDAGSFWNNLAPSQRLFWPQARVLAVFQDTHLDRVFAETLPSSFRTQFLPKQAEPSRVPSATSQHTWQRNRQKWFSIRFFMDTLSESQYIALVSPDALFVSQVTEAALFASGGRPRWPITTEITPKRVELVEFPSRRVACMSTSPLVLWRDHVRAFRGHMEQLHGMAFDDLLEELSLSAMWHPQMFEELFCNYAYEHQRHLYAFHVPSHLALGQGLAEFSHQPLIRLALQGSKLRISGRADRLTSCLLEPPWQCRWSPIVVSKLLVGYCRLVGWQQSLCSSSRLGNAGRLHAELFQYEEPFQFDWAEHDAEGCVEAERRHKAAASQAPVLQEDMMRYLIELAGLNMSSLVGASSRGLWIGSTRKWWEELQREPAGMYSQSNEDRILHLLFEHIGMHTKFYIEIGAEDGRECNSRLLREKLGFQGLTFDVGFEDARIGLWKELVLPNAFASLLSRYDHVPHDPDLLSIDVDSFDAFLLRSALAYSIQGRRFRPRVLVVEANDNFGDESFLSFPGDVEVDGFQPPYHELCGWTCVFKDPRDGFQVKRAMCGAGTRALVHVASEADYFLVFLNSINMFFLRSDLVPEPMQRAWTFDRVMLHSIALGREKFAFPRPECAPFLDGLVDVREV